MSMSCYDESQSFSVSVKAADVDHIAVLADSNKARGSTNRVEKENKASYPRSCAKTNVLWSTAPLQQG